MRPNDLREILPRDSPLAITRIDGLTEDEGVVADALVAAVHAWRALPVQHPDETREFIDAIHACQNLLPIRIARREYPAGWPTYPRTQP